MKEMNIVGGGPIELIPDLTNYLAKPSIWIGVDRGVQHLLTKGIVPDVAFGDFDSVTVEELNAIKAKVKMLKIYKPEKDETDMELALSWALEQNSKKIRIFGGTGGRLDHFFANIQLLLKPLSLSTNIQVELIDEKNHVYIAGPGTQQIKRMDDRKYVSFVAVSPVVEGLTLTGFKYPLTDYKLPLGSTLCISNELVEDYGHFSFSTGILMIIRSID